MSKLPAPSPVESTPDMPFAAPCRTLDMHAPLRWLILGWQDLARAPRISLTYGLALTLLSLLISVLTWRYGTMAMYLGLVSGFVFIGPILAAGLYSISRQLAAGRTPRLGYCMREGMIHFKELLVLGIILLVVLLLWARAATVLSVFLPVQAKPDLQQLLPFIGISIVVAMLFASLAFAASAFSLPMIIDRRTDSITAVITSIHAVLHNKKPMLLWAGIIAVIVLLGFATGLLGFLILLPLIGHATWHAYHETIDASAWPENSST